jgi:hypothetical protein
MKASVEGRIAGQDPRVLLLATGVRRPAAPRLEGMEGRTPTERFLERKDVEDKKGERFSQHSLQYQRTLEGYLQAGNPPRWMQRLGEIQQGIARARRRLGLRYEELRAEHAGDGTGFAQRWREEAERYSFDDVNTLIEQHNEWFPIERNLAINPRTRDYVLINGRSYRREPLDASWVLAQFPAP